MTCFTTLPENIVWNTVMGQYKQFNGANRDKYGDLKRSMAENYVTGTSEYPESHEVVLRILNALGPKGYLINVARGSVVNEDDLISALQNKIWLVNNFFQHCHCKNGYASF